jgi:hypothetical protein
LPLVPPAGRIIEGNDSLKIVEITPFQLQQRVQRSGRIGIKELHKVILLREEIIPGPGFYIKAGPVQRTLNGTGQYCYENGYAD